MNRILTVPQRVLATMPAIATRATVAGVAVRDHAAGVPWFVWCATLAVTSAMIGTQWDIAWHRSIGRDTFWTPAHVAIYFCGVLAGISSTWLIMRTTFGRETTARDGPTERGGRRAAVSVLGFKGPLGAFIAAWGSAAMLCSAPFDDWWHAAYGLDVKILSPPHMVLILGLTGVQLGALVLVKSEANRARGRQRDVLESLFLYLCGAVLVAKMVMTFEHIARPFMHTASFYVVIAMAVPGILALVARATQHRWAATIAAGIYTAVFLAQLWLFPLVPAAPKLGPVYIQITHLIPWEFPLLIIAPAIALDLLRRRMGTRRRIAVAFAAGVVFMATFAAVQWPFADFLMSPASRNPLFGTIYFGYNTRPTSLYFQHRFAPTEPAFAFVRGMGLAVAWSVGTTWVGMVLGDWFGRLRR